MCLCCSVKRTPHTQEAAQEAAFLQILAQVRDSARETERALLSGHINRHQADVLRGRYRATTRALLEALLQRQQFERSDDFRRSAFHRALQEKLTDTNAVISASDRANRLSQGCEALFDLDRPLKEEEPCAICARRAHEHAARPEVSLYTARAVKRPRLTPHPRAGPDACAAAGAVQALIDDTADEGGVFSSTEEEESDSD